jgi:hypothetical protein
MAVIESGDASGNLLTVNDDKEALVNLPTEPDDAGFVRIASGEGIEFEATESGHFPVSLESIVFFDQVDGNTLNQNLWFSATSTMTIAQSGGFITLNSGSSLTANAYASIKSIKAIPFYGEFPMEVDIGAKVNTTPQANLTMELGVGVVTTNSVPTDGCFFRWAPDGTFRAVINFGGSETSAVIAPPVINEQHDFDITIDNDEVVFEVDGVEVAEVAVPVGQPFPLSTTRVSVFARIYNGASGPSSAGQLSVGRVAVVQQVLSKTRRWEDVLVSLGYGAYQAPVSTQSANHANSASPSSATLSNTAAGYSTLGGRYQFAAVGGAATDYALFAYLVPLGYQLIVTGVRISSINTGAAVATTATILDWAVGINASAVSLATADSPPTSWAPRRIPLGIQGFLVTAGIGQQSQDIDVTFATPLVVDGGRYFHVILQLPVGTATASQVIRGDVMVNGYFE